MSVRVHAADAPVGRQAVGGAFKGVAAVDDAFGGGLEGPHPTKSTASSGSLLHPVWSRQRQKGRGVG